MDKILQSGTCGGASEHHNGNVCAYVHSVDENEKNDMNVEYFLKCDYQLLFTLYFFYRSFYCWVRIQSS